MSKRLRVSCVSYLNSQPFIFGLNHHPVKDEIHLSLDHPADCARKLIEGKVDIGLIPVAAIPLIRNAQVFPSFCIGANGPVKSVMLLSQVPLHEISVILLDYQSNTSVQLVKILANHYWKIKPGWLNAVKGYESKILGKTAGVVIGDRALHLSNQFEFAYDLSAEWKMFTGMPFVFACWVSNKIIPEDFLASFESALSFGLKNIDESISQLKNKNNFVDNGVNYLKEIIDYNFDESKKEAMTLFLHYCNEPDGIRVGTDASLIRGCKM